MTIPVSPVRSALACSILLAAVVVSWAAESATTGSAKPSPLSDGIARFEAGEYEAAAAFFGKQAAARPQDAQAAYYLGRIHYNQEQAEEAVQWFVKAADLDPADSEYQLWLGRAYLAQLETASMFSKLGLSKKVRAHYSKAIELDPDNLEARESLAGYLFEAPGIAGGSTSAGMEQIAAIKQRNPARGHLALGSHYYGKEDYDDAVKEFRAALSVDPKSTNAYFRLALLYQATESWTEALAMLDKLLELEPDHLGGQYQIGRTAALSGQGLDRGIESLSAYLESKPGPDQPSLAWAHYRLGLVYAHKGDVARARQQYELAVKLDPEFEQAKDALKKLR